MKKHEDGGFFYFILEQKTSAQALLILYFILYKIILKMNIHILKKSYQQQLEASYTAKLQEEQ
ncbi:hypothetical protein [Pseudoneobacillus rhizosphaerae]|uniref:hypothetical protein n=1 Tax=Pseudoneobacillus rhizosphaerae TaxID=2880968 RepID=UPI001E2BCCBD|nr:hypothetical protein [Pseudoneobacillus rhizosphaerae]